MMWGYGGWGGFGILFPIFGLVMMVVMMYFMSRMMMGHHDHPHRNDTSELLHEIRNLRQEVDELKRDKGKGDL